MSEIALHIEYQGLLYLNPLTSIVEGYHNVILYDKAPELYPLLYPLILSLVVMFLGLFVYSKAS